MTATRTATLTASALAALALTGCTTGTDAEPVTTTAESALSATGETVQAARGALDAAELDRLTDPAAVKATAIEAGRPEPAWDKNCIAWSLPEADTEAEQLARDVAAAWLDHHGADCPDQIMHPGYYAEDFAPGGPGEVIVTLDDEALADYFVNPYDDKGLQHMGFLIMGPTRWDRPDLDELTVTVEGTDRAWTVTPEQVERGILTAPAPPHVPDH
jgi:hypothetical protein